MKKLKRITVKHWVSYKEATLVFEPGVTIIHGRNLDRPEKNSSNAAGKSLIVSLLPDLRYGAPPLPLKSKKNWKENFNKSTEQSISIVDEHDNKFTVTKTNIGMQLLKNGRDQKIRGKVNVELELEKLIPLNEEQFYSFNYLDTKRPPVLQYGTDAQRHAFIEKLYRLDVYDKLAQLVKKDWEKTQRIVQDIEVLDRQLNEKSHGISGDPEKLKHKHKQLVKKTEEIRQKVSDYLAQRQQCNTFITLAEDIDLSVSSEDLKDKLDALRTKYKHEKQARDAAVASNKKHEAYAAIETTRKRLNEELEQYKNVKIDKSVQDAVKKDHQLLDEIELIQTENKEIEGQIEKLKRIIVLHPLFKSNLSEKSRKQAEAHGSEKLSKQLSKEKGALRELQDNLRDTKEHFDSHDDQSCPICSTALDKQTMEDIIKIKQKRIDEIDKKIKILNKMVDHVENKEEVDGFKQELEQLKNRRHSNVDDPDKVKERIEANEALLGQMRKKIMCRGKLKELPEIEDTEIIELEPLEVALEKIEARIEKYTRLYDSHVSLDKLELPFSNVEKAKRKKAHIDETLAEYQPLLNTIQEKLNRVSVDATRSETLSQEVSKLSEQITELKLQSADHKIKTALRKAFGPRGIRKQRVAEIGAALETTFNDYADQIFDFPIRFELVITDTKFQILAHRNGGVSDVRRLSGAESRYFSLLTMLTLLKYCPTEMRLDTVILDEIEANLDIPFKRRYVDVCIPKILEIVPKVVIVTPQSEKELFIPKAKVYVVEKKNNVSTLHKL